MKTVTLCLIISLGFALDVSAKTPLAAVQADAKDLLTNIEKASPEAMAVWPGFNPDDYAQIILGRDAQKNIQHMVVINHPRATELGQAHDLGNGAWLIINPKPNPHLASVENFEFNLPILGQPAFVIGSDCADTDFDMSCMRNAEFAAYHLHEMFHRYQDDHFIDSGHVDQDAYDYSADNLYLARLENEILAASSQETDQTVLIEMAQRLVALRAVRSAASDFVTLDEQQERYEGTASFIEHNLGHSIGSSLHAGNYGTDLTYPIEEGSVKADFGFGRFYGTGAAILHLADRIGVKDMPSDIEGGMTPMQVLAKIAPVPAQDAEAIVSNVIADLDPNALLRADADQWAAWAKTEPSIWDDFE